MFIRLIAVLLAILATPYAATGMTFVWSPNDPIENVTGYKIYYGPSPSPPYDGVGADQGNSPIDAGNITQQEVTFPASYIGQTLYFVATAYSDLSESDYSTVVVVTYDGSTTQTVILSSSAGEGGTVEPYGDNPVSVGTDFTFRFFPDLGYTLSGLLVDSISVNPEPEYTFWDVGQSHDIIPIFQFVEPDPTTTDPPPDDTTTDPTITNTGLIWQLDYNGNGIWDDPVIDRLYSSTFGSPGDSIITGDWNNDGKTEIGTVTVDALGTGLIWQLDYNGNGIWDGTPVDYKYTSTFGSPNDLVITGDWNNDGRTKIGTGTVNSSGGLTWYLDYNGNGTWDGTTIDRMYVSTFGSPGDTLITGDWNNDGRTKIGTGTVNSSGGLTWYLDYNGNGIWDGTAIDRMYVSTFGSPGDILITGDWNDDGKTEIGVVETDEEAEIIPPPPTDEEIDIPENISSTFGSPGDSIITGDWNNDGKTEIGTVTVDALGTGLIWQLDYNGNGIWDGSSIDRLYSSTFGSPEDLIISGDWNNDGKTEIGTVTVDALGTGIIWQLDYNGNGIWDGSSIDRLYSSTFGSPEDLIISGDWNNDGRTKIGTGTVNSSGGLTWYLDYNGNGTWDGTTIDRMYVSTFGSPGDTLITGDWNNDGRTKIGTGTVNSSGGLTWYLDYNGNGIWDGTAIDRMYVSTFGSPGDILITGDWNDDGKTEIGIVKPNPTQTGLDWYLDCNGNGILDNDPNIDCIYLSN